MFRLLQLSCALVFMALGLACGGSASHSASPSADLRFETTSGQPATPQWMAVQDGDGPWVVVEPSSHLNLMVHDPSGRYGVAYTQPLGDHATQTVVSLSTCGEHPHPTFTLSLAASSAPLPAAPIQGTASGLALPAAWAQCPLVSTHPHAASVPFTSIGIDQDGPYQAMALEGDFIAYPYRTPLDLDGHGVLPPDRYLSPRSVTVRSASTARLDVDFTTQGQAPRVFLLTAQDDLGLTEDRGGFVACTLEGASFAIAAFDASHPTTLRAFAPPASWGTRPQYTATLWTGPREVSAWMATPADRTLSLPSRFVAPSTLRLDAHQQPAQWAMAHDSYWDSTFLEFGSLTDSLVYSLWVVAVSPERMREKNGVIALPLLNTLPGRGADWRFDALASRTWALTYAGRTMEGAAPTSPLWSGLTAPGVHQGAWGEVHFSGPAAAGRAPFPDSRQADPASQVGLKPRREPYHGLGRGPSSTPFPTAAGPTGTR